MSEEPEFTLDFDATPDVPFYLRCPEKIKEEARRAYVLAFITDGEGVLLKNWDEEAAKLEEFLKTGAAKPRTNMKVVK